MSIWNRVKQNFTEKFLRENNFWWKKGGNKSNWTELLQYAEDKREYGKFKLLNERADNLKNKFDYIDNVQLTNIIDFKNMRMKMIKEKTRYNQLVDSRKTLMKEIRSAELEKRNPVQKVSDYTIKISLDNVDYNPRKDVSQFLELPFNQSLNTLKWSVVDESNNNWFNDWIKITVDDINFNVMLGESFIYEEGRYSLQRQIGDYKEYLIGVFTALKDFTNEILETKNGNVILSTTDYSRLRLVSIGEIGDSQFKISYTKFYNSIKNFMNYIKDDSPILNYINPDIPTESPFRLYATKPRDSIINDLEQIFREDVNNKCFFEVIRHTVEQKMNSTKSKREHVRCEKLIDKIPTYENKYPDGVKLNGYIIADIAQGLNINIIIKNLLGDVLYSQKSGKKNDISCYFYNNRINHVDKIIKDREKIRVDNIEEIATECKRNNEFCIIHDISGKIHKIETIDKIYKSHKAEEGDSVMKDYLKTFERFFQNSSTSDELNEFLQSSYLVSGSYTNNEKIEDKIENKFRFDSNHGYYLYQPVSVKKLHTEYDMEKCYTQFKKCGEYYQGFPAKIHTLKKVPIDHELKPQGIYNGILTKSTHKIFNILSYFPKNENTVNITLPTPEIKMLKSLGCEFKPLVGAWGSRMDFDFPQDMLEKDNNGRSRYAIFSGRLGMVRNRYNRTVYGNGQWADHIKNLYNDKIQNYEIVGRKDNDDIYEIRILDGENVSNHALHIASYITSYARINMIRQLQLLDLDEIIKITLDSFYTNETDPKLLDIFRSKGQRPIIKNGSKFITPKPFNYEIKDEYDIDYDGNLLLSGHGGGGKTYWVLNNYDFIGALYVCDNYRATSDKKAIYGSNVMVVQRMVKKQLYEPDKAHITALKMMGMTNDPNVIVFDEITKYYGLLEILMEIFPYSKFILIGDVDENGNSYQLEDFEATNSFPMHLVDSNKEFKEDYRCKDEKLRKLKKDIRSFIREYNNNFECRPSKTGWKQFIKEFKNITKEELIDLYQIEDSVLISNRSCNHMTDGVRCGEHHCNHKSRTKQIEYYTNLLWSKGEKYMYIKGIKGNLSGEIVYNNPHNNTGSEGQPPQGKENIHYERRHAFTCYSIQGETLENNIFIDTRLMWNPQMFYVAVSRARRYDQIYIIA